MKKIIKNQTMNNIIKIPKMKIMFKLKIFYKIINKLNKLYKIIIIKILYIKNKKMLIISNKNNKIKIKQRNKLD